MSAFNFYKLQAEQENYKYNFELVEQYNRNRSVEDHITDASDINNPV